MSEKRYREIRILIASPGDVSLERDQAEKVIRRMELYHHQQLPLNNANKLKLDDKFVLYNDRMEIKSPGALLSTITINNLTQLEGAHESRNSLIARVLRENRLMREIGEGMKRIFSLMHDYPFFLFLKNN